MTFGTISAASTARIAITTITSMRVNARMRRRLMGPPLAAPDTSNCSSSGIGILYLVDGRLVQEHPAALAACRFRRSGARSRTDRAARAARKGRAGARRRGARARGALARGAAPLRRLFGAAGRLLRGGAPDRRG